MLLVLIYMTVTKRHPHTSSALSLHGFVKINLFFVQMLAVTDLGASTTDWLPYYSTFTCIFRWFPTDDPLSSLYRLFYHALFPIVMVVFVSFLICLRRIVQCRKDGSLGLVLKSAVAFLLYALFFETSLVFLEVLITEESIDGKEYLTSYPYLNADSDVVRSMRVVAAIALFVYLVVVPLFFAFSVMVYKHDLPSMGFLTESFKSKFFFYELVLILRRIMFVLLQILLEKFEDRTSIVVAVLLCFAAINVWLQPFVSEWENLIDLGATFIIVIVLISGNFVFFGLSMAYLLLLAVLIVIVANRKIDHHIEIEELLK
jgi:hypothetical protein